MVKALDEIDEATKGERSAEKLDGKRVYAHRYDRGLDGFERAAARRLCHGFLKKDCDACRHAEIKLALSQRELDDE